MLPFLDIQLDISNNCLNTTVYRKPTYTGLILNYKAPCPLQWKRGLINTLINRAYIVCSSWSNFHNEMNKLINIFKQNGYPTFFIYRSIKQYLDKQFTPHEHKQDTDCHLCVKIPYFGIQSIYFRKNAYVFLRE